MVVWGREILASSKMCTFWVFVFTSMSESLGFFFLIFSFNCLSGVS